MWCITLLDFNPYEDDTEAVAIKPQRTSKVREIVEWFKRLFRA